MNDLSSLVFDPLEDGHSRLSLIEYFGGDLAVVNDAKASYARKSTEMGDKEARLIKRLIGGIDEPQHTSPLRGTVFKFKVKCPLFVARQWWKHHVASSHCDEQDGWNETSFRYVPIEDGTFYLPETFKSQHNSNKQASGTALDEHDQRAARLQVETMCVNSWQTYNRLLQMGVAREQARMVLVPSFYTTFHWTCSLQALFNFIDLREGHGAQPEIAAYVVGLKTFAEMVAPYTLCAWFDRKNDIQLAMELLREHQATIRSDAEEIRYADGGREAKNSQTVELGP